MDDICEYCGLYGCDSNECILNKNNYEICECCGLTGHNKNECSFKNIVKKMDIIQKNSIQYIKSIFPDTIIFVKKLYNPIQRNIIITYDYNSNSDDSSIVKYANLILTSLDGVSVFKYYYILYNDGHIECGSE